MGSVQINTITFRTTVTTPINQKADHMLSFSSFSFFAPKAIEKTAPLPIHSPMITEFRKVISV